MFEKLKKCRSMPAREVLHRLREKWHREADRIRFYTGLQDQSDREIEVFCERNGSSLKGYLRQGPRRRFYLSTQNRKAVCELIDRRFLTWFDRVMAEAGRLCQHRVDLLDHMDVSLGTQIYWHWDPVAAPMAAPVLGRLRFGAFPQRRPKSHSRA